MYQAAITLHSPTSVKCGIGAAAPNSSLAAAVLITVLYAKILKPPKLFLALF